eukprot:3218580-Rhodomonas_salina.2
MPGPDTVRGQACRGSTRTTRTSSSQTASARARKHPPLAARPMPVAGSAYRLLVNGRSRLPQPRAPHSPRAPRCALRALADASCSVPQRGSGGGAPESSRASFPGRRPTSAHGTTAA